jgi:hypothetical protein
VLAVDVEADVEVAVGLRVDASRAVYIALAVARSDTGGARS